MGLLRRAKLRKLNAETLRSMLGKQRDYSEYCALEWAKSGRDYYLDWSAESAEAAKDIVKVLAERGA